MANGLLSRRKRLIIMVPRPQLTPAITAIKRPHRYPVPSLVPSHKTSIAPIIHPQTKSHSHKAAISLVIQMANMQAKMGHI